MNRRAFLTTTFGVVAAPAFAQVGRPARIGILSVRAPDWSIALNAALLEGLRGLGYVDGRNVVIDYPDAQGREDRLPGMAADFVRKGVDVIVVVGPAPLPAARAATREISDRDGGGQRRPGSRGHRGQPRAARRQRYRAHLRRARPLQEAARALESDGAPDSRAYACCGTSTRRRMNPIGAAP
jgi:hypothetical protein